MDFLERIQSWAQQRPDHLAHVSGDRTLTYGELDEQSSAVAAWLDSQLGDEIVPIAVHGHKEPEMLVAFLAAVKSGRPYVPIDSTLPAQRAERIIAGAGSPVVLTPEKVAAIVKDRPATYTARPLQADSPFYILFTSGSTGDPKGVVITLRNLMHFLHWMESEQGYAQGAEIFLNQAPFSFDLSVMDTHASLYSGGTLFSITKDQVANPKFLYAAFAKSGLTTWVTTPSFAQMCLVEKTFTQTMLPQLRRFLFCGETLPADTAAALLDRFPNAQVWNTYGPTEATVAMTSLQITRDVLNRWNPLPIGRVMPGTRAEILAEDGAPAPDGERGELVIIGPNVSPGYKGRPDLTERVFYTASDGMRAYKTGDWARSRDGLLFWEGRMDGQVKVNGFRIELGDLESNLRALSGVADAVVLPVEAGGKITSLAACIVLAGERVGSDFEISARLKTALGERLPAYMIPRKFRFFDAFPMTVNSKADRRALAALMAESR